MVSETAENSQDDLLTPIAHLMSMDILTLPGDCTVAEAAAAMSERGVGCVVVLRENGGVEGVFTERDLLSRVVGVGLDVAHTRIGDVMTREVTVLDADTPFSVASDLVNHRGFRHVPVVSSDKLVGIVSMRDLFRTRLRRVESRLDEEVRALRETQGLLAVDEESRVQALIAVNRRLQELALTDELTGLYNHRFFHRRLKEEVGRSQRLSLPLSLLFADIDHFKRVNDAHGHPNGDRVLRHVATLLRDGVEGAGVYARLRRSDVVTRYGGEEFAVLLMDARTEGAASVAERIRSAVAATPAVLPDGTQASVTLSLGVASIPYNAVDADELVRVADQALYRAKSSGRNRVETSPLRATPAVG